jgi:glycosyltransferase involved in cell wall biosynthesis
LPALGGSSKIRATISVLSGYRLNLSLLITTYNWPEALDLVLESVARQHVLPSEVVVADDGSAEPTARLVAAWQQRLQVPLVHVWQEDTGFRAARSRNRGIAAARTGYVVMIDGDMVLDRRFIADHIALAEAGSFVQGPRINTSPELSKAMLAERRTQVGILTPGVLRRQQIVHHLPYASWSARRAFSTERVKSCNMGCWRADLIAVNGFDERMIGWGPEDKELAVRLFNIGIARKHVRHAALAAHLYHARRDPVGTNPNDRYLDESIANKSQRCAAGIDAHLAEFAHGIPSTARPPWALADVA